MGKEKKTTGRNGGYFRKKLWQVEQGYHCSLIGVCLSRNDLRVLAQKKSFEVQSGASDIQIHQHFTATASLRSAKSRALHKMLDQKYRLAIRRYRGCQDDEAIKAQWEQDLKAGKVAGAYWAIMTSGVCSSRLLERVYGDCHMLSYEPFARQFQGNRKIQEIRSKLLKTEKSAEARQKAWEGERKRNACLASKLQQVKGAMKQLEQVAGQLTAENKQLQAQVTTDVVEELENLRHELAQLKQQNVTLQAQEAKMSEELQALKSQEVQYQKEARKQHDSIQQLLLENSNLNEELTALETMLGSDEQKASPCKECDEQNTGQCRGPDLCGKTILYVGGRHGMVSRYRRLVENRGGNFLHHDGGRENSRQLLPKMLTGADAVFCPVDCISHDACNCVKRVCKKYQKPYVMMRSSGLSSLARGLGMIQA